MSRHGLLAPLLLGVLIAAPSARASAPLACTQIGCLNGLTLSVAHDYRWSPGAYVFRLEFDNRTVTCRGNLPLPACGISGLTCDGDGVMITESGCALSPAAQGFGDVQIESGPPQVAVSVMRDGQTLVHKTIKPAYRTARPNGAQCDPECRQASVPLFGE